MRPKNGGVIHKDVELRSRAGYGFDQSSAGFGFGSFVGDSVGTGAFFREPLGDGKGFRMTSPSDDDFRSGFREFFRDRGAYVSDGGG